MSCSFDKAHFTAEKETTFQVTVLYNNASGAEGSLYLSARDGDSSETKGYSDGVAAKTGVGACQLTVSAIPTHGGRYFVLTANLLTGSVDNSDWYGDSIYITPEGEVSENYAPLNAYGSTEFIYRSHYKDFSSLDAAAQSRVISIAEAAIAGDQEKLLALVDTNDGLNSSFYTIWNGYKINITDHAEWELDNDGDERKSFLVEIRPENGTGYHCFAYKSRMVDTAGKTEWLDYSNSVLITSCPCVDWQWNGSMTTSEAHEYFLRLVYDDRDTTCHTIALVEVTGTMIDGLLEGTAVETTHEISDWSPVGPADSDKTITETRLFQNGILIEENGEKWTGGTGYHLIGDYAGGGTVWGNYWQDFLENRYW